MKSEIPIRESGASPTDETDSTLAIKKDHAASPAKWEETPKSLSRNLSKGTRSQFSALRQIAKRALRIMDTLRARVRLGVGTRPISDAGGWDRGTAINRYYLEEFLQEFSSDISGCCLEFQTDLYTSRFGRQRVTKLDILHKQEGNKEATLVADLAAPNNISSNTYDCIICTYVLHTIFEYEKVVFELHRILKPGGVLLIAVPDISRSYEDDHELWRFTPEGLHLLLAKVFGFGNIIVRASGNSLSAAALIRGLASQDLTKAELDPTDSAFAVAVFARACKLPNITPT